MEFISNPTRRPKHDDDRDVYYVKYNNILLSMNVVYISCDNNIQEVMMIVIQMDVYHFS